MCFLFSEAYIVMNCDISNMFTDFNDENMLIWSSYVKRQR